MTPAKKDLRVDLPPWAQVSEKRRRHIVSVTTLLDEWASVMRIPEKERVAWWDAGRLHDALKEGTRGIGGLEHVLLGSVAERTIRLATCPVLTVKSTSTLPRS